MEKFILISLLILAASKNTAIEFGKEVPFDENNNKFQFDTENSDAVFIQIVYESSDSLDHLDLEMTSDGAPSIIAGFNRPGGGFIFPVYKDNTYTIALEPSNPDLDINGTIWVNPAYNEIKVNLTKKYEWKFDYENKIGNSRDLIYIINKSEKTVTFEFKYNSKMKLSDGSFAQNPFQVCHGGTCSDSVTTYEFKEGESYKIYAKVIQKFIDSTDIYILPSFYFCEKSPDGNLSSNLRFNFWVFSLLLISLSF